MLTQRARIDGYWRLHPLLMTGSGDDDRFLEERAFRIGGSIDLGDLIEGAKESLSIGERAEAEAEAKAGSKAQAGVKEAATSGPAGTASAGAAITRDEAESADSSGHDDAPADDDIAIGSMYDPFAEDDGMGAGAISVDGTVALAPETDAVSRMAVEGEQRLHWGLMAAMISVYSLISLVVGFALPPIIALLGLVGLAVLGFSLGERWVPKSNMHNLGIVWVIIAMKILYGLVIELHSWELFGIFPLSTEALGLLLLILVGVNILVAYRHDHDAIATQAVLVLLALSSTAGSFFGEIGVAAMLFLATMLVHSLALHRKSGNLASLGIAASNLWIGMHAVTSGFSLGSLTILPLQSPLLLFLLLMGVNGINATMASRFAREENWFSKALSIVGLGKPGLWSVSVGLGMVGALMAIAANRDDSAYAIGMVTALLAAFVGSYLHVRGVDANKIQFTLFPSILILTLLLILFDAEILPPIGVIAGYELFAIGAGAVAGWLLLSNQENVTDRVLWMGSLGVTALLTVLIPAHAVADGGDGGLILLIALAVLHIGTTLLALKRFSPSLAGTAVITPWLWVTVVEGVGGVVKTFTAANAGETVDLFALDGTLLAAYLILASLIQLPCNLTMGDKGVNLAERFLGITEVSARLRDSGMLRLWNLGWLLGLAVWLARSGVGDMPGWILLLGLAVHAAIHIGADISGRHQDNPRVLLAGFGIAVAILMWRHGMDAAWLLLFVAATAALNWPARDGERSSQMQMMSMSLLTLLVLVWGSARTVRSSLSGGFDLDAALTGWLVILVVAIQLGIYLPRLERFDDLLRPALASIAMLIATIAAAWNVGIDSNQPLAAAVLMLAAGLWLAANGEIRSELKQVVKREERLASLVASQQISVALAGGGVAAATADANTPGPAGVIAAATTARPDTTSANASAGSPEAMSAVTAVGTDSTELSATSDIPIPGIDASGEDSQRTYQYGDDATASLALQQSTPEARAEAAQAVSVGGMKTIDPRMVELAAKQKKRLKKSGSIGEHDLLIGDIHHRPVIILAFIMTAVLGASFIAYLSGAIGAGLIAIIGIWSITLILISRWRASIHDLRLPDIMGIETPFATALLGLALIQLAGHISTGASKWNQVDMLALVGVVTMLAVISLSGRKDLAMRIPSALEWLVLALLLPRLMGALFGEANPFPLLVDPFDESGTLLSWTLPHLAQEGVLLLAVFLWDWVEGVRRAKSLPDHRGAGGRGMWAFAVVLLSIGPAGIIAAGLAIRRGWQWQQPAAVSSGILAASLSLIAFSSWIEPLASVLGWVYVAIGICLLIGLVWSVPTERARWTGGFALDAHLLLPIGLAIATGGLTIWVLVGLFALSMTSWTVGILQLRKALRFWGAFDLGIAVTLALLTMRAALLEPVTALIILTALAVELGIVVWLGQRHQEEMSAAQ